MHLVDLLPISFQRETTFVTSCLLSCAPRTDVKMGLLLKKRIYSQGNKLSPFRVDPFDKDDKNISNEIISPASESNTLKIQRNKTFWHLETSR